MVATSLGRREQRGKTGEPSNGCSGVTVSRATMPQQDEPLYVAVQVRGHRITCITAVILPLPKGFLPLSATFGHWYATCFTVVSGTCN